MVDHSRITLGRFSVAIATTLLTLVCSASASAQLLVTDNFGPSVLQFNQTTGAFEGTLISLGSGVTAHSIQIGPDGNIYAGGSTGGINRYSPSGTLLGVFTSGATIDGPLFFIFGPDGNLYASDYTGFPSIKRFNGTTGAFMDTFVPAGSGGLSYPNGMAFGRDGNLYVSSGNTNSVKRYQGTTGAYLGDFSTGPTDPRGLTFGPDGNLYVSFDGIRRYNGTTGAFIDLFAFSAGLDRPYGVAFGPDGNLYVANDGPHPGEILRYNGTTGAFMDVFASGGGLGSPKYFVFTGASEAPPTAEAGANQSIHAGQTVRLDGSGSSDDTTATEDLQYTWSFTSLPPDSTATFNDAHAINPTFVADQWGTYVVTLVVADGGGLSSAPDAVTISSLNTPPNANAGADQGAVVGRVMTFDGSASSDPDADPLTFSWTLITQPAGSVAILSNANTATPTLTPDVPGSYIAALVVNDPFVSSAEDRSTVAAISAADFAAQQTAQTLNDLGSLPASALTTQGNRKAFANFLTQAIAALQTDDVTEARKKLQDAMDRTDGCTLRGSPDPAGSGQIKQDYITNCADQIPLYSTLKEALDSL